MLRLPPSGNYGNPAAASDTLEILGYLREASPTLTIGVHSNGSPKNQEWWRALAHSIGTNGYARFAIDGLEETTPIYRRNTDWQKIVQNAAAHIAAGGRAEWDFIVCATKAYTSAPKAELARVAIWLRW